MDDPALIAAALAGGRDRDHSMLLAPQVRYGALPLRFVIESIDTVH